MDSKTTAEAPEAKLHFLDYWRIIRIRKAVILIVFLLVTITTTVVTLFLPKTYASMVRISVDKDVPDIHGLDNRPVTLNYDPFFLQTEFEKIQSSSVLYRVIEKLNLNERWSEDILGPGHKLRTAETFLYLKKRINVKQSRNTSLIEIWVKSRDKAEAVEIANEIAFTYRESRLRQREEVRSRAVDKLRDQLRQKEEDVKRVQQKVNEMRQKHNIPDIGGDSFLGTVTLHTETLRHLEQSRSQAMADYVQFNTLLDEIKGLSRPQLRSALPTAYPDPQLASLLENLSLAEQRLTALLQDFAREHPDVKRAQAVVDTVQTQVNEKIDGIIIGLESRVAHLKARLDTVQGQLDETTTRYNELAAVYRPYFDAKRELENEQRVKEALTFRIQQETIEGSLPVSSIVDVVDRAEPAIRAASPNIPLNIALGIFVGLIVGVGLAFFIEYLDTSVKTIDDVERAFQAPVLGVIPQNVGPLIYEGPESPHAEAYRVLRTNVLFARKDENFNTISVLSGGAGEGKSTTLFNLATIFAQSGHRVLVVDSDLRRPSIHKILKVSNSIGLTNYLLKQNTLEEVIQTTILPTLDVMPSGKLPSSSMGILSSAKMKELILELKRRYDFVFFDSPPLLGVSDASILASEVDLVVQVIQYRRYPQPMTLRAKQMIEKVGGNLAGIVLNNINVSQDENYYYYSGYYYDYYSKQDDDDDVKESDKSGKKPAAKEVAQVDIKSKY